MYVLTQSRALRGGLLLAVIALLALTAGIGSTSAAKPAPAIMNAHVAADPLAGVCRFEAQLEWDGLRGPGLATVGLVGDPNATSATFKANGGGVTVHIWPASNTGPVFGQLEVLVTKKNGTVVFDETIDIAPVSCA